MSHCGAPSVPEPEKKVPWQYFTSALWQYNVAWCRCSRSARPWR